MFCSLDGLQFNGLATVEGLQNIYCFPEVSVNKYFIIYQESNKRKNKRTSYENT